MIEIKNVSMEFSSGEKVLDDISFTIPDGSIYGFIGSNGAGKSTLMRMICGIYDIENGEISIDDESISDNPSAKEKIFFVNDETVQLSAYSLSELRKFYKSFYKDFSDETFEKLINNLSLPTDKKLSQFSKGMKRQAIVVLGLSAKTKYLMLDEAFDGLDPAMRKIIKQIITDELCERNATLIISSHNISEISEFCDRAMLLHRGKLIFADDLDEIKGGFSKIQIAFKDREITKEKITACGVDVMDYKSFGSVAQVIAKGNETDNISKLGQLKPDILEIVPLTLEEIFIYELEVRGYGKNILDKD